MFQLLKTRVCGPRFVILFNIVFCDYNIHVDGFLPTKLISYFNVLGTIFTTGMIQQHSDRER